MKKVFGLLLASAAALSVAACGKDKTTTKATTKTTASGGQTTVTTAGGQTTATTAGVQLTEYEKVALNTSLGLAVQYNATDSITHLSADPVTIPGIGANGADVTLSSGDLLPVWKELQYYAGATFVDKQAGKKTADNFPYHQNLGFAGVDLINGNVTKIVEEGLKTGGKVLDLAQYMDFANIENSRLPYLQKFLMENPTVFDSVMSENGAIYFAPYFDGMNELENMILLNHQWVRNLLDGDAAGEANKLAASKYTATEPETNSYSVDVYVNGALTTYTKSYTKNIITAQNDTDLSGAALLSALKAHIDATYADAFTKGIYTKRSDVFVSSNAGYDVDELVALMRVVKTNPKLATGNETQESVEVLFPRSGEGNRCFNLQRFMQVWGIRGVESRCQFMYLDGQGNLCDVRTEEAYADAIDNMNKLYQEGLIVQNFTSGFGGQQKGEWRANLMKTNSGFMTYDYNGTTSAKAKSGVDENGNTTYYTDQEYFNAVLPPLCKWNDGDDTTNYYHFSESSRGVKSDAWCITTNVVGNEAKLTAALRLVDFLYSPKGNELFCYGVDGMYNFNPDGVEGTDYEVYLGQKIPAFTDAILKAIADSGKDNFVWWRSYCGNTTNVGYVRELGVEYQTLTDAGKASINMVNDAVEHGNFIISKTSYTVAEDPFFYLLPSQMPLTAAETTANAQADAFTKVFTTGSSHGYSDYIMNGFGSGELFTREQYLAAAKTNITDIVLVNYKKAWQRILDNQA